MERQPNPNPTLEAPLKGRPVQKNLPILGSFLNAFSLNAGFFERFLNAYLRACCAVLCMPYLHLD